MNKSVPSSNPLLPYLNDALRLFCEIEVLRQDKDKSRCILSNAIARGSTLHALAVVRSFINNLCALFHLDPQDSLEENLKEILKFRGAGAPSKDEIALLREFEIITMRLLNPMIQEPHATLKMGTDLDVELTPLFKCATVFGSWGSESAAAILGAVLRILNEISTDKLKLSDIETLTVFGYTIRTEDGFTRHMDVHRVNMLFEIIPRIRKIGEVWNLNRGGNELEGGAIVQKDFDVRFLKNPNQDAPQID